MKYYPVVDPVPGVKLIDRRHYRGKMTGECRAVLPGEWYVSGAIPETYRYMGTEPWLVMNIAEIVKVKVTTTIKEV